MSPLPEEPSVWQAAIGCRCPRCGRGRLYAGLLTVRDRCEVCGLDLSGADAGDGAAVGVILVLSAVIVGLVFWVELAFSPPLWVHAIVWPIITVPAAIVLMRPSKAALIALQYRNRRREMGL